jgi:non-heme chloroperoxidase
VFFGDRGFRVIAHDRRSPGRSGQTWTGTDKDTYTDDLATLIETLDLKRVTLIGHTTGGGEVARYIGPRYPTSSQGSTYQLGAAVDAQDTC